jgi:nucleoside-diphosphate-sugar epimerase
MTSPVLVTGGTGRLGRSVVARLVEAGQEVRVLARRQRDTHPQATFFTGDLRRGDGIDPAVRAAGVIIHCATSTLPPPGHTEGVRTWDQFLAEELAEHRDPAARVKSA